MRQLLGRYLRIPRPILLFIAAELLLKIIDVALFLVFNLYLRQLGHEIVAWEEEALVRFGPEDYYRRRLSEKAVGLVSHLFAWGEDDAEVFRKYPAYPGTPIHVTGNPRIDLMRPDVRGYFDSEVADIRRRFGDPVLVNTNFGFVNAFASSSFTKTMSAYSRTSSFMGTTFLPTRAGSARSIDTFT